MFLFLGILFVPGFAIAQGSGSYEPPPRTSPNDNVREETNFVVTRSTSGSIVGIKEGILTIKTSKEKVVVVAISKNTKFKLGKKTISIDELDESFFKEGRGVKITYRPIENSRAAFDKIALLITFEEEKREKPTLG